MAFKAKRYSTSFKVVMIMLMLIMAGYTLKVFTTGTKQKIIADTDTVAIAQPVKRQKKHHIKKQFSIRATTIPVETQPFIKATQATEAVASPVAAAPAKPTVTVKASPDAPLADSVKTNNNYLYTTYVQPNVTGIVKLRATDKFNSDVLTDIPARSAVRVLAKGVTYYRVVYNNAIGYVPKWALNIR